MTRSSQAHAGSSAVMWVVGAHPDFMKAAPIGLLAAVVLTDSVDALEETTALRIECLSLDSMERPITVEQRIETIVATQRRAIRACVAEIVAGRGKRGDVPDLGDGDAAQRTASDLGQRLCHRALTTSVG